MAGVFISYRRSDSDVASGRLADDLSEIFGRDVTFRDVDRLQAGEDYTAALEHALDSCAALIAMIGSRWSSVTDEDGHRRLDDPADWVRLEIKRALERGIRVIPVLISANMPREADLPPDLKPLLHRQALELSDRHWKQDVELLAQALEAIPGVGRRASAPRETGPRFSRRHALTATGGGIVLGGTAWLAWWLRRAPGLPAPVPVDLSPSVRVRDSGPEGSVAGLAVVAAMETSLALQKRPVTLSARYLYEKAKTIDRLGTKSEGTDMTAALYVAETFGAPPEDRWPYVAGVRELPKNVTWPQMDEAAANFRARTFRLSSPDEISQHLERGRPVLAQVNATYAWSSPEVAKTGRITLGEHDMVIGGHAIVIVGFNPVDSSIKFLNSWGVGWGANGFGTISVKDAQRAVTAMWAVEVPPAPP